jgi:pimeloyl-ACP methyl ester carboxylesterase
MKIKIIILLVLVIIFAPFVSTAEEVIATEEILATEEPSDLNEEFNMDQPVPEPIIEQANLTVSVIIDDSFELRPLDQHGLPQILHLDMESTNDRGQWVGATGFDLTAGDFFNLPMFFNTVISTTDNPYYSIKQKKFPGIKLVDIFCTSSDPTIVFDRNFGNINFIPKPGANIECVFTDIKVKVPVLIVPGLLGTEMKNGDELLWADIARMMNPLNSDSFMDPLAFNADLTSSITGVETGDVVKKLETAVGLVSFDYTEGLINEFKNQGYVEGVGEDANLFLFPYDWRYGASGVYPDSGATNAILLADRIQEILDQTGAAKVDIVAHSLGGLIVKQYVKDIVPYRPCNSNYGDCTNIRKAVFVGVPNTGAPKAVKVLLQGDNFGVLGLNDQEMKKISADLPVSYDLLPSQKYYNIKGSFIETIELVDATFENPTAQNTIKDLTYEESKSFLTDDHKFNSLAMAGAENLHTQSFDDFDLRAPGVDLYSINGCKKATLAQIKEVRGKDFLGADNVFYGTAYNTPKITPGDGTVPLESATNLPIDEYKKYYALSAEHGKMLSQDGIRQQILNILIGNQFDVDSSLITQDLNRCQLNGKAISVFSPVNIFVTDQNGNRLGLADDGSIINEIPNASFEIWGEHKFVYLPQDSGQVYTISLTGTGEGTFTIQSEDIQDSQTVKTEVFSDLPVTLELAGNININSTDNTVTLSVAQNAGSLPETILADGLQPEPEPEAEPEPEPEPESAPEAEPVATVITPPPGQAPEAGRTSPVIPAEAGIQNLDSRLHGNDNKDEIAIAIAPVPDPVLEPVKIVVPVKKPAKIIVKKPAEKIAEVQNNNQQIATAGLSANTGFFNYFKSFASKFGQFFFKLFKK